MGKGHRHRAARRAAREQTEAARAAAEARRAFFAAYDPEDSASGPALPCPACGAFGRRWADADAAAPVLAAFDARWGLPPAQDDRRVAICGCGEASVVPRDPEGPTTAASR